MRIVNGKIISINKRAELYDSAYFPYILGTRKKIAVVRRNGKWGVVDKNLNEYIECIYEFEIYFHLCRGSYYAIVTASTQNGFKQGIINVNGEYAVELGKYAEIYIDGDLIAVLTKNHTITFLNEEFEPARGTEFKGDEIGSLRNGVMRYKYNEQWGYFDYEHMLLVHARCKEAEDFTENGLAVVSFSGEKYDIIDRKIRYAIVAGGFDNKPLYLYGRLYRIIQGGTTKIVEV